MLFSLRAITKIMRLIKCRCRCSVLLLPLFLRSCSCTSIRFICTTMLIGCCHLAILILSMSVVCQPFSPFSLSLVLSLENPSGRSCELTLAISFARSPLFPPATSLACLCLCGSPAQLFLALQLGSRPRKIACLHQSAHQCFTFISYSLVCRSLTCLRQLQARSLPCSFASSPLRRSSPPGTSAKYRRASALRTAGAKIRIQIAIVARVRYSVDRNLCCPLCQKLSLSPSSCLLIISLVPT